MKAISFGHSQFHAYMAIITRVPGARIGSTQKSLSAVMQAIIDTVTKDTSARNSSHRDKVLF